MKITSFEDIYKFYGKTGTIEDFKNNFNIYKEKLSETIKWASSNPPSIGLSRDNWLSCLILGMADQEDKLMYANIDEVDNECSYLMCDNYIKFVSAKRYDWVDNTKFFSGYSPYISIVLVNLIEDYLSCSFDKIQEIIHTNKDIIDLGKQISQKLGEFLRGQAFYGYFYPNTGNFSPRKSIIPRKFTIVDNIDFTLYYNKTYYTNYYWEFWKINLIAGKDLHFKNIKFFRETSEYFGWRLFATEEEMRKDRENLKDVWRITLEGRISSVDREIKLAEKNLESLKKKKEKLNKDIVFFNTDKKINKLLKL